MRVHAYVLAGDPAWARESVSSYYDQVARVVVSYDALGRSWAGHDLRVTETVAALRSVDRDNKLVFLPGSHSFPDRPILEVETEHRQQALDAASDGADWVLQLDTDEVVLDAGTFMTHLLRADSSRAAAMDYPLRDFYQRLGESRFLEHCSRFWGDQANYPGPVAVRAGTRLVHCRQVGPVGYRVDLAPWNTDPSHPRGAHVHAVVRRDQAIAHLSWVRDEGAMQEKAVVSGYASAHDWVRDLKRWRWRRRHPVLTALTVPFRQDPFDRFRVSRLRLPTRVPVAGP